MKKISALELDKVLKAKYSSRYSSDSIEAMKGRYVVATLDGKQIFISFEHGDHLMFSTTLENIGILEDLKTIFSTIMGVKPFCHYIRFSIREQDNMRVIEWDVKNPEFRFKELSEEEAKGNISNLEKYEEKRSPFFK